MKKLSLPTDSLPPPPAEMQGGVFMSRSVGKRDRIKRIKKRRKELDRLLRPYKYQLIKERSPDVFYTDRKETQLLKTEMRRIWKLLDCANKPIMVAPFLIRVKAFIKQNCPDYKKRLK